MMETDTLLTSDTTLSQTLVLIHSKMALESSRVLKLEITNPLTQFVARPWSDSFKKFMDKDLSRTIKLSVSMPNRVSISHTLSQSGLRTPRESRWTKLSKSTKMLNLSQLHLFNHLNQSLRTLLTFRLQPMSKIFNLMLD